MLEGERDAGLEQAQEMAVIIGGKEKQLADLRDSLSELDKEAAEAKSFQVHLKKPRSNTPWSLGGQLIRKRIYCAGSSRRGVAQDQGGP